MGPLVLFNCTTKSGGKCSLYHQERALVVALNDCAVILRELLIPCDLVVSFATQVL